MQKPEGYDELQVGSWTPIELGGHKLIIKGAEERKSKSGMDMLVISFDFDKDDKQPGYFADEFAKDVRPDKKWPNSGTKYIMTTAADTGKASKDLKTFITSVEDSNKGFVTKWGDEFCKQFKGKKVGAVFGEVENEYNGKVTMRHELRWFCSVDNAKTAAIPAQKLLGNRTTSAAPAPAPGTESFMTIADGADEDIPF